VIVDALAGNDDALTKAGESGEPRAAQPAQHQSLEGIVGVVAGENMRVARRARLLQQNPVACGASTSF
jgi:hypothetical protein